VKNGLYVAYVFLASEKNQLKCGFNQRVKMSVLVVEKIIANGGIFRNILDNM
jgi:hypothetical protein